MNVFTELLGGSHPNTFQVVHKLLEEEKTCVEVISGRTSGRRIRIRINYKNKWKNNLMELL